MNEHTENNVVDQEQIESRTLASKERYLRPIDTARRLRHLMWCEFELSRAAFGWLPAVDTYEGKTEIGRYGYVHNQHMGHLYSRLQELPGNLNEKQGTPPLIREAFERMTTAPSLASFYGGYLLVLQNMYADYDQLKLALDPILDAPTLDKLKFVEIERHGMIDWARKQAQFAYTEDGAGCVEMTQWKHYVAAVWVLMQQGLQQDSAVAEVIWPTHPAGQAAGPVPTHSTLDPRFPVYVPKSSVFQKAYSDTSMSPLNDSVKQMHYINATEIGAAESLCYFYYGVQRMPLQFYLDTARHLWDEIRHSQMGLRRLTQMGYKPEQFFWFKGSSGKAFDELSQEYFPEMYASLTMVAEPCSFIKKRKSAEKFWEFGDALSAIQCEFDMVDERMHVDFGKKWGPELFKQINDPITAQEMSDRMRTRRVEKLGAATSPEEINKIIKNFPGFCGLSTIELEYSNF